MISEREYSILPIDKIRLNDNNPRLIKDDKFQQLCKSIQDFPEMLQLRSIIVDERLTILGGNMRYRACLEIGIKDVPVIIVKGLTEEQKKEFIIKDNVSFGEWDYDLLKMWDITLLNDWGLTDIPEVTIPEAHELTSFFEEVESTGALAPSKVQMKTLVLEFTTEQMEQLEKKFTELGGDKSTIVYDSVLSRD